MEKYIKKHNNIIINNKLFDSEQIYGHPPNHKNSDGVLRYYGNGSGNVYNSSKGNIMHGNNGCGKSLGNNYSQMVISKNHGKYNENYIYINNNNNNEQNYRRSKHNDEIKEIIENGNVKRKTLLYNNIVDSNKQLTNKLNALEMNTKRDSDVKRCIDYFNSLRKGNVDIKKILENKNFKELNIPKEHLDNGQFFNYLEYYKKHNLKELIDYFDEINTKDNNERVSSQNKNKITTSGSNSEKNSSNGNKLNKGEEQKGILNSKPNEISENKTEDLKTNKNKRPQYPSFINGDETDEKLFYQRKKTKHEKEPDPVFYTIDDLFD
ncbi:conserved Plasmodium protein, unknown function [Plasmodium berghei]|uniref:Uncharacterized protein n=2 Tax=Plasmodium berghei TaxID=5821 RepID=A0A509ARF1_PLABA|nr:conserved protein, unknown function [Plasmodium berghei ANKA]CXJ16886.1 conserved Plasmodium protein, unknown function [Plasmodium berghei]SCM26342.1 conserved Plasmodium protein, unknown function [Plasmodium berghei]SCN28404.1 conserved Plasmodium protein, unknown function [Plasmodium berghei]SCO62598.1 conserved Plasmodium protein, unknown function [Plasmodium berghei]SCO64156.1 conserved Plasmodium protein, unknown function [Plasmodium berghei]|eukprot:XP_034424052.1 conserved protein, unknown function [Plasmodium berghei ANKA]